jgi:hypothetical protein
MIFGCIPGGVHSKLIVDTLFGVTCSLPSRFVNLACGRASLAYATDAGGNLHASQDELGTSGREQQGQKSGQRFPVFSLLTNKHIDPP